MLGIIPKAGLGDWYRDCAWGGLLAPGGGERTELRLALASELAVGAVSLDATDSLDVDPTVDFRESTEAPLVDFFAPILPAASITERRLEPFVPTDETIELGLGLPVALPATEPVFELVPERMLLRLVRVVPVPIVLFLLLDVLNVGNGDLARDEDALVL